MGLSFQKISYHYPYKHISLIVDGFSSLSFLPAQPYLFSFSYLVSYSLFYSLSNNNKEGLGRKRIRSIHFNLDDFNR